MFEEKHENFKTAVRKLELPPAATKVKMSGSVKKANRRNTYHISSIKRVTRMFHVVVVQNNGNARNVQKSVLHLQSCFLLITTIVLFFFLPFTSPSPFSITRFFCLSKL